MDTWLSNYIPGGQISTGFCCHASSPQPAVWNKTFSGCIRHCHGSQTVTTAEWCLETYCIFSRGNSHQPNNVTQRLTVLLAIYSAIQHFRHFLEGRTFTVFTDHKPLAHALTSNTDRSPRQERQLCYIAEFTTDIRHVSGSHNIVPDTLSRAPVPDQEPLIVSASAVPTVDLAQMAAAQETDPNVSELHSKPGALQLKNITLDGTHILCDVSTGRPRPVVPPAWTKTVFDALHNLCHPGPKPTTHAISARYIWPGLKKDVKNMVRACHECQASKIGRHTKAPLSHFDPLIDVLVTYTWTLWDPSLHQKTAIICLLLWTDSQDGQKLFLSPTQKLLPVRRPYCALGSRDSVSQTQLLQTKAVSSPAPFGGSWTWCLELNPKLPQPTTPRPTAWWKGSIAASKLRSKLALTDYAGWTNYQSWCLASGQRGKKILTLLLFFSPMAQTSECLAISFHPHVQTRCSHPVRLSKNCKKNWENFPLSPLLTMDHQRRTFPRTCSQRIRCTFVMTPERAP